uniref:PPR n=1 Tax=Tremella fuciformis TaxID=64657 RepID=D5KY49_9TREE|nr:PPR [Tremella fuciformis]
MTLVSLLRQPDRTDDALAVYRLMMQEAVLVPHGARFRLARALQDSGSDADREIWLELEEVQRHRGHETSSLGRLSGGAQDVKSPRNALRDELRTLCHFDQLDEAAAIWSKLLNAYEPSRSDCLAYAAALAKQRDSKAVVEILGSHFGPAILEDPAALEVQLAAHVNAQEVELAQSVFDLLSTLRPSVKSYNAMLQLHTALGNIDEAVTMFDALLDSPVDADVASYTILISLFARQRDVENAEQAFDSMRAAGLEPDGIAYAAMLNAYVEAANWQGAATRWSALPRHLQTDPNVANVILKAFVLLAYPTQHILTLFRAIAKPTVHDWALAILSAADNADLDTARDLFEEMTRLADRRGSRSPRPNVYIYSILLHGYMRIGDAESARSVYDEMQSRGIVPSSVTYGMIIATFTNTGSISGLQKAHEFASTILNRSMAEKAGARGKTAENLVGPLLVASGRIRDLESAEEYFDMGTGNHPPTIPMYTKLMDAYRKAGQADSVKDIWGKIYQAAKEKVSYGSRLALTNAKDDVKSARASATETVPGHLANNNSLCIPLSIALDTFASTGRYADVRRVWGQVNETGLGRDAENYNHYAAALAKTGDIEGAFAVVSNILLPRYDEVLQRREAAQRPPPGTLVRQSQSDTAHVEHFGLRPELNAAKSPADLLGELGDSDNPPHRPPNRRHEQRFHMESESGRVFPSDSPMLPGVDLLKSWRPSDVLWRPSLATIATLDHAYSQLEDATQRSRAWMAVAWDENDKDKEEGDQDIKMRFPAFNNVPLRRHSDGEIEKRGPRAMLMRLNSKYARVVGLIMFHRRKRPRGAERGM